MTVFNANWKNTKSENKRLFFFWIYNLYYSIYRTLNLCAPRWKLYVELFSLTQSCRSSVSQENWKHVQCYAGVNTNGLSMIWIAFQVFCAQYLNRLPVIRWRICVVNNMQNHSVQIRYFNDFLINLFFKSKNESMFPEKSYTWELNKK